MIELSANLRQVTFSRREPRDIISQHSYSILAESEPLSGPLPSHVVDAVEKLFTHAPEIATKTSVKGDKKGIVIADTKTAAHEEVRIARQDVPSALGKCGFEYAADNAYVVERLVLRYSGELQAFTKEEFLILVQRLQAPAFHFGEHLRKACGRGDITLTKEYLVRGCNVNTGDGEGQTALHLACAQNRAESIQLLREVCGLALNVNAKDKYECSALWMACLMGYADCVSMLIGFGADVNSSNAFGKSCLHAAASKGFAHIVALLIKAGATIQMDSNQATPLHEAVLKLDAYEPVLAVFVVDPVDEEEQGRQTEEKRDLLEYTHEDYALILGSG